ncbi:MAG: helix-turn-helix domain-containing protein [Firmicutes bacterium]|nr:helix-turn-helix domain-containing protein [Bacillota bacterium]
MNKKSALTIKETAREYGFPEYAIRTLVRRGAFPVVQCGNRCYIVRSVFEEYLQKGGALYDPKL